MQMQEITLLTSAEYQRLQHLITDIQCTWWLRDEGKNANPYSVSGLDAKITDIPNRKSERYVRPAIRITGAQHTPGTKLSIFAYSWTVLETINDVTLVLCDTAVTCRQFDTKEQKWSTSEIKLWLEAWLTKRQKTSNNQKHKCYKRMNEIGMEYITNTFLRCWVTPMALLWPMTMIVCQYAWSIGDTILMPTWLHHLMWYSTSIAGVFYAIMALQTALNPHKDTTLRHMLNTLCFWVGMLLLYNNLTFFGMIGMICILLITVLNCNYLRKIKYYS